MREHTSEASTFVYSETGTAVSSIADPNSSSSSSSTRNNKIHPPATATPQNEKNDKNIEIPSIPDGEHKMGHLFFVPILTTLVPVVTLFTCAGITLSQKKFIGTIAWPYFSDTGSRRPPYYVFAVGLSVSGALIVMLTTINLWRTMAICRRGPEGGGSAVKGAGCVKATSVIVWVFSVIGGLCLALLAIFNTIDYPSVHNATAYAFFLLLLVYCISTAVLAWKLRGASPRAGLAAKIKVVIASLLLLFVILYLPVGLSIIPAWKRLTIADCINREGMSADYCSRTIKLNDTETKLWDYAGKGAKAHLFRSITQLLSVLSLLFYFGSFAIEFREM
jgi:hypothetical membrane protein